jgi:hypothetical protein
MSVKSFPLSNLVITQIRDLERANQNTLYFMEFANPQTYKSTGALLTFIDSEKRKQLTEGMKVNVELGFGQYQGKSTVNVIDLEPVK